MAKAGNTTSKNDPIYLAGALELAVAAFGGSVTLAKKRLTGWLATGELPWDCDDEDWKAPDAAEIAKLNEILAAAAPPCSVVAYYKGDPRFFADDPEIDWENSTAREASYVREGAQAEGIKVSRTRLLELLPAGDVDEASTKAFVTAEVKRMKVAGEIPDGIKKAQLAKLLQGRIKDAAKWSRWQSR